ncbi:hypothetical protein PENFLA_c004G01052 [Penicillium flavigenum]|uniref:Uncharacterized protein n=1 Tax=Penicillium flavigenum TaxID=254877 RepID=A0A1V6TRN6_9EURO|nr:hypothetical protein PENFLA_c004G01052 [Penicillium flavigenum]
MLHTHAIDEHPRVPPETRNTVTNRPTNIDEATWSSMTDAEYRKIISFSLVDKNASHYASEPTTGRTARHRPYQPPLDTSARQRSRLSLKTVTRKRKRDTTTNDIRRMSGSFSLELLADCDDIDVIVDKLATIAHKDRELNTLEAQRILRLNDEILQDHQGYEDMVADMSQRLVLREDWQRCVLQNAFNKSRQAYTDKYGASDEDDDGSAAQPDDDATTATALQPADDDSQTSPLSTTPPLQNLVHSLDRRETVPTSTLPADDDSTIPLAR